MAIKGKPDLAEFLTGSTEAPPKPAPPAATRRAAPKPVDGAPKRQKLVELPLAVFDALKERALSEYKKTGRRVTETEIIITALSDYLGVQA
jgi:hypothetical protein